MDDDLLALIQAAKKGDTQAFGKIYAQFYEPIYRFVYFLIYDPDQAKDLTQDAFLKLWKAMPKFESHNGSLKAYLYMIARNTVIDFQRQKKEVVLDLHTEIETPYNIEEQVIVNDQNHILYQILDQLNNLEKQLLVLRFFEDLSMKEIATIVDSQETAVRVRIHRLLKKVKEMLQNIHYAN